MPWLPIPADSDFSIHNLPYGVFSTAQRTQPRVGVAIGDQIIDMAVAAQLGTFDTCLTKAQRSVFSQPYLNDFIRLGRTIWQQVRRVLQTELSDPASRLKANAQHALVAQADATMHMPVQIGDYTDFYSSIDHASNVGKMFRDPANALLPNWRHLPVGYHGRASSVVVSGTSIRRPQGQRLPKGVDQPVFGPSQRLDFELETAFIVGKDTALGTSVTPGDFDEHAFGMVLFNDWSARDIQQWEYVPLGPFLGKSFASSVSPWVVTIEALAPFRVAGYVQEPEPLPYLHDPNPLPNFDINLTVELTDPADVTTVISRSNQRFLYWSQAQQLAHHTINGCNLRVGDLMASGTISGPDRSSWGSLLELSWGGAEPLTLADGSKRTFLEDGDTVTFRGWAGEGDHRVGFGEVTGTVL
ncbi:fumarylacetoacetase [Fibrella aestuarina BUZ 2]|uniref:fumarylacetoacetase n=1 Tax=Fibrella aestuarina BUZ 2 TaxID=1166018 RepID=I0KC33_9BACT|nr:fumarylacetoacetase [Fibrella aestuarina]CCH01686.1 fumarylacetoacetase [Fibrella aestuarina BUZ 2]